MRPRLLAACAVVLFAIACSSSSAPTDASVACCPPSPRPECCMQLGGWMLDGVCPPLTCDIPDPNGPGWQLWNDSHGCLAWRVPNGPHGCGPGPAPTSDAGSGCSPADVSSYQPPALTPARSQPNACAYLELEGYYDACVAQDPTSSDCLAFEQAHPTCSQCVTSQSTDAEWGPIVRSSPTSGMFNIAGCVALITGDSGAGSCAQRVSDTLGCEWTACDAVCPITDAASELALEQCTQEADLVGCRGYLDAECDAADAGYDACLLTPLDHTTFAAFASPFCGP